MLKQNKPDSEKQACFLNGQCLDIFKNWDTKVKGSEEENDKWNRQERRFGGGLDQNIYYVLMKMP